MKKEFPLKGENITESKERLILELYRLRKKAKISQVLLAEIAKMPQVSISRIESLTVDTTLKNLVKYAEALGFEVSLVLKSKDENNDVEKIFQKQ